MQEQTVLRLLLGQRNEHLLDRRVVQPHLCLGPHPPQILRRRRPHERDARRVLGQVGLEVHGPGVQPAAAQVVADGLGHTFPLQADGAVAELGVLSRPVRCDEVRADLHTGLRFLPELCGLRPVP